MKNPIKKLIKDEGYVPIIRTLGCIGDSLSSGEHESTDEQGNKGYNDYYEYSWGQFIARKCGLTARNYSRGGYTAFDFFDRKDFPDMFDKENLCQAYIIALGANDLNRIQKKETYQAFGSLEHAFNAPFEENLKTFVGCYVNLIKKIREHQPKSRIFVVTMPRKKSYDKATNELHRQHAEFLRALPNFFEFIYVIDLNMFSEDYSAKKFVDKYMLGGHMNAMGYKYTADLFITYIDYIIRNNLDDFRQIGFVLKDGVYNHGAKW